MAQNISIHTRINMLESFCVYVFIFVITLSGYVWLSEVKMCFVVRRWWLLNHVMERCVLEVGLGFNLLDSKRQLITRHRLSREVFRGVKWLAQGADVRTQALYLKLDEVLLCPSRRWPAGP